MFSVVIPLFNMERHIGRAVASVLAQGHPALEVIVVDDGSRDGGALAAARSGDPRVRVVRQPNAGASAARNRGIAEARGEFISFLDADDVWKPGYLETVARLAARHPEAGAYATAYRIVLPGGREVLPHFRGVPRHPFEGVLDSYFRSALGPPPVCSSAVTVPARVFREVGCFPVGVPLGEDLDMWGRIALRYPIAFSSTVGACYFQQEPRPGSRMAYYRDHPEPPFLRSLREALARGEVTGVDPADLCEYGAKLQLSLAYDCLVEGGDPGTARRVALAAAPASPGLKARKYRILAQSLLPAGFSVLWRRIRRGA